jgi:serine/threonine protein kinase
VSITTPVSPSPHAESAGAGVDVDAGGDVDANTSNATIRMGMGMTKPVPQPGCHPAPPRKPREFGPVSRRRTPPSPPVPLQTVNAFDGALEWTPPLNLLCPACHTPLPAGADAVVRCSTCAAEVDVTRAGTISGRPRFVPEIDRAGTDVGGFRIDARLGGGGMGTVYRATAADGAAVAVKFLAPALADNPDVVARFAREIATLTRLEHPAIVRVLAHGTQDGTPWFAMALVDGSDLRARIAAGALPPAETAAVFGRLFAALAHAHERGVVHRDLKPANVLLGAGGAQLADFGIARLEAEMLTGPMVTRLTETAAVLGTLPYMSPEQRRGGAVDRRSDLFSAGVMLYEAATGLLPQGAFALPSELNPAYGRAFDRIVVQLLQADPARRPAAAPPVEAALAAALAPRRRRPLALALAGSALATVLVGGALGARVMFHDRDARRADRGSLANVAPETSKPAAAEKALAPETPTPPETPAPRTIADELGKSATPSTAASTGKAPRLGKIKQRVVLKAVSDVKKLRSKQELSKLDPAEPVATTRRGGKKKAKMLDAELAPPELKSSFDPEPTRPAPDAGTAGAPPVPERK